jgi:hypothetical protein
MRWASETIARRSGIFSSSASEQKSFQAWVLVSARRLPGGGVAIKRGRVLSKIGRGSTAVSNQSNGLQSTVASTVETRKKPVNSRACPGHPRLTSLSVRQDADARHKAGHDDKVNRRVRPGEDGRERRRRLRKTTAEKIASAI